MFTKHSFVNSASEYAYDCYNRSDMLLRDAVCDNAIVIDTQYGSITVSGDTLIATGKGLWKRAEDLQLWDDLKHHIMGKSVITEITQIKEPVPMFKVIDCKVGYLVVNGFYIASDM